jgi:esterase/lipase
MRKIIVGTILLALGMCQTFDLQAWPHHRRRRRSDSGLAIGVGMMGLMTAAAVASANRKPKTIIVEKRVVNNERLKAEIQQLLLDARNKEEEIARLKEESHKKDMKRLEEELKEANKKINELAEQLEPEE